jgi:hypothetical protein
VEAITGFIGYKAIVDIPMMYLNSFEDLPIKAVGSVTLKRSRQKQSESERPLIQGNWLFSPLFRLCNIFYKTLFFYFFPLATILMPMLKSLDGNIKI